MAAKRRILPSTACAQRGFALIALLAILTAGVLYFVVGQLDAAAVQRKRDEVTTRALAQAKEALIAYAVSMDLSGSKRPGDLPCPDLDDNGKAETSCGSAAGSNQAQRLRRLPWLSLGLPELRDGSGEHLWYAVSNNFKNNTRTATLNSDTLGTITVRDNGGNILFDGSGTSGVVAVVIAPGAPIVRQDGLQQSRSGANVNDPKHYLDNIAAEDNADFDEVTTKTNGFFAGPVHDATDPDLVVANDRIAYISREEIVAAMEKRVAREVLNCLTNYAAHASNGGRYPWAVDLISSAGGMYEDVANTLFGRVPLLMCNTGGDGATPPCAAPPVTGTAPGMLTTWGSVPNCYVSNTWFTNNWQEQVFMAIADGYKPGTGAPGCGTCLTLDSAGGKQMAVLVARRRTGTQSRTSLAERADATQYLEDINSTGSGSYVTKSATPTFNDLVLFR